ncbi:MAG TPA: hypothetical protein ENI85_01575, partial [Deltaproteobacteria bacterium]|nr:hypothetical protein [Deltaproteobacteria bacterium]
MKANDTHAGIGQTDSKGGRRLERRGARIRSFRTLGWLSILSLLPVILSCTGGDGSVADNGGMSGTGISQGSISSFGSIFVNGVEWEVGSATVELDGTSASAADLRLGMVVRIQGDFGPNGTTGSALSVVFDDSLEGPIERDPVDVVPGGLEKSFSVLGTTVVMHQSHTTFANGAGFASLVADDVVEVSGFLDATGSIQATRIELKGSFPAIDGVELHGTVANLMQGASDDGDFELGGILVHYVAAPGTIFSDGTRNGLTDGNLVEVKGTLRINGVEIDASEIEFESRGLSGDADEVEIEGFVTNRVSNTSFRVDGTLVDASMATFEPGGLMVADGAELEVEGRLENGVLLADRVKSEDEEEARKNVEIKAAASAVDGAARQLTILGVTIVADGETKITDERDGDEDFMFSEIQPGDFLDIEGIETGPSTVRALDIKRKVDGNDVELEGPVSALDTVIPTLSVLGQSIPLNPTTAYFDDLGQPRTEEQFFRNPGDVMSGDVVRVRDMAAADLAVLAEADRVDLEG